MSFITSLGDWLRKITRSFTSASISGQSITLTRHNGDTVVLTIQDTVNNAFTKIKIGTVTLEPDSTADTLTIGVGAGILLSANATNDSITIGAVEATQSIAGIMSTADKIKLDGITSGAEPNQNAFAIVKVGATSVTADTKQDTLNLSAGTGITISPNATTHTVTISVTDNTYAAYSHTHAYLPLSGGTMTGNITMQSAHIVNGVDTAETQVHGGTGWSKGATLALHGYDKNVNAGVFALYARDANAGDYVLRGSPSGELKWYTGTLSNDDNVAVISKYSAGSYYIRFSNGLQMCAGSISIQATGTERTFPVPFSEAPRMVFSAAPASANSDVVDVRAYPRTATGFTAWLNYNGAHASGNAHWFAYGRWK